MSFGRGKSFVDLPEIISRPKIKTLQPASVPWLPAQQSGCGGWFGKFICGWVGEVMMAYVGSRWTVQ